MTLSFDKLYQKNYDDIYRFIRLKVNSEADTKEIVSDVFFKAFNAWGDKKDNYRAWLFRIAINTVNDYYRQSRYITTTLDENIPSKKTTENIVINKIEIDKLQNAIDTLNEQDKLIISLRYDADLRYKDIAAIIECEIPATRKRANRALAKLRNILGKEGEL